MGEKIGALGRWTGSGEGGGGPVGVVDTLVWQSVCVAPCRRTVPFGVYRVSGEGITPTRPFRLEGTDAIAIALAPRRWSEVGVGAALTVVGGLGILGGAVAAWYGTAIGSQESASSTLALGGFVGLGVGLVATVIGLILLVDGAHSGLRITRAL